MTGVYTYTAEIWPSLTAAFFLAALGLYSWRRRSVPAARPLVAGLLFCALWMVGIALEVTAVAPAAKVAWHRFQAACQLPAATAMACFALEYASPGRWLTRRNLILLVLPPLASTLLIVTDSARLIQLEITSDGAVVRRFGVLGAIMLIYGLCLGLVNMAAFLWLFIRSPQHRWPVALLLLGDLTGRSLYGLYGFNAFALPALTLLNSFVISLLLTWTMYAIALFGFRIFDPLPAARRAALEQMRDGMVVLDDRWRVASLNPAAASVLSIPATHARGKTLHELLPAVPDWIARITDLAGRPAEQMPAMADICLGTGSKTRHYALMLSLLKDFRGLTIGRLLLLHDVTEQRRAQTQLLNQQWVQAALQEREQLAYELHDSLSQDLAFLNVQAQAVQLYLQSRQDEAARASLARLAEVARDMQSDVRELIGSLLAVSLPSEGFCATLRQVVARFETQTGLAVFLDVDGPAAALCEPGLLPASVGVQLIRIVQEALTNIRKHAGRPSQVTVRLRAAAAQMQLVIEDDGAGFDPAQTGDAGKHFGLQVMRQRAERINGQLAIHSALGQGTRVEVSIPSNPPNDRG